jgi:hypothetical protein
MRESRKWSMQDFTFSGEDRHAEIDTLENASVFVLVTSCSTFSDLFSVFSSPKAR